MYWKHASGSNGVEFGDVSLKVFDLDLRFVYFDFLKTKTAPWS